MDGSAFSSPLDSPEAPITSSVVTLQSAESLSCRRQVRHSSQPVVDNPIPQQSSLTKTPDTPPANLTPSPSSEHYSQAFTSHFTSESSLLQKAQIPDEAPSPSAILTPSTETDDFANGSEDIDYLNFDEDPWDITSIEFDLQILNVNGKPPNS